MNENQTIAAISTALAVLELVLYVLAVRMPFLWLTVYFVLLPVVL